MEIAIVHNAVVDATSPDERDVLDQVAAVRAALVRQGHAVREIGVTLDLAALQSDLERERPDLVFNLVESLAGTGRLIATAPLLFDAMSIPYTGASAEVLFVSSNKLLAKHRLAAAGLPTPQWVEGDGAATDGKWIVKSVWEHASIGMDDAVVVEAPHVGERLRALAPRMGGTAFAERYVPGREINVAVLDGQPLPPVEIRFVDFPSDKPAIVGYRAKWAPGSFEYDHTVPSAEFEASDRALLDRVQTLALGAWRAFDLRGYARVDFRVDERGAPWILEVNANPCLSPDAGFARSVGLAGLTMDEAVARIVAA